LIFAEVSKVRFDHWPEVVTQASQISQSCRKRAASECSQPCCFAVLYSRSPAFSKQCQAAEAEQENSHRLRDKRVLEVLIVHIKIVNVWIPASAGMTNTVSATGTI
jgi:hypothetical protein